MKKTSIFLIACLTSSFLGAVMAPWYWVGFPIQLNADYPGNPDRLIGAHYTFIFDTYHYENGKAYPAGRIMHTNSQIFNWYVALVPQRKGQVLPAGITPIAFMEPTPWVIQMLQLPKNSTTIAVVAIGTPESWSEIWMADRKMLWKAVHKGAKRAYFNGDKRAKKA